MDIENRDPTIGEELMVTRWGRLNEGGIIPVELPTMIVPVIAMRTCNGPSSYGGDVTDSMFCPG